MHDLSRVLDPSRSAVVVSCAGSGKTWLLISRILRALLDGVRPEEILAITFTRKATGEIFERVRERLREFETVPEDRLRKLLEEIHADTGRGTVKLARNLGRKFLLSEKGMTIRTFHGWFQRLLRSRPWLPDAQHAGEITANDQLILEDAWDLLMSRADRNDPAGKALLDLLEHNNYRLASVKTVLKDLINRRELWMLHTRGCEDPVEIAASGFERLCGINPKATPISDLHADSGFRLLLNRCTEAAAENSLKTLAPLRDPRLKPDGNVSADEFWTMLRKIFLTQEDKPRRDIVKLTALKSLHEDGTLNRIQARIAETRKTETDLWAARLNRLALRIAVGWFTAYEEIKESRRMMDHSDLEVQTWNLLTADNENAVAMQHKMGQAYRHILVDEFQDTSPLQWDILRSWLDSSLEAGIPPKVFIVGDPKQSIYRFRGGDPMLLQRARDYLESNYGAETLSVNVTRRCSPSVVRLVNHVFSCIGERISGFESHSAFRDDLPGRIEILPKVIRPEKKGRPETGSLRNPLQTAPEDREESTGETETVARRIAEIKAEWKPVDKTSGKPRPCGWDDIMVLYAQKTRLAVLERALRKRNIPCATRRSNPLLSLECQDMAALMAFIINPSDSLALAHTLRSPAFGVDTQELASIAILGDKRPLWLGLRDSKDPSPRLERARKKLVEWRGHYLRHPMPAHDFLSHVYHDGEVLERYRMAVDPDIQLQVQTNLVHLLHLPLALDQGRHPQLPLFLREFRRLCSSAAPEMYDAPMKGQVALLSIHSAKGLERPFVLVFDSLREQRHFGDKSRAGRLYWEWPKDAKKPTMVAFGFGTPEKLPERLRGLSESSKASEEREWLNMLYIALTRASQAVVFSGTESERGVSKPELNWYELALRSAEQMGAQKDGRNALVLGDSLEHSATAVPKEEEDIGADAENWEMPVSIGTQRDRQPPQGRRGELLHALMSIRMSGIRDRDVACKALSIDDSQFGELWDVSEKIQEAESLRRFFDPERSGRHASEVAIVGSDGKRRRIDLLVELEDELWILDFKTGNIKAKLNEYREQLESYRASLCKLCPGKTIRCGLVSEEGVLTAL